MQRKANASGKNKCFFENKSFRPIIIDPFSVSSGLGDVFQAPERILRVIKNKDQIKQFNTTVKITILFCRDT